DRPTDDTDPPPRAAACGRAVGFRRARHPAGRPGTGVVQDTVGRGIRPTAAQVVRGLRISGVSQR
ncbi:hypothetical protein ABZX34_03980, partial [Streptomyces sp. NPDC004362]|uniref:hypothetical protein n=1 Tax=Streptomyces sp. NPDC004362 TaxID=3154456 RepID=UPI0033B43E42